MTASGLPYQGRRRWRSWSARGPWATLRAALDRRASPTRLTAILGEEAATWRSHGRLAGESGTVSMLVGPATAAIALLKMTNTPRGRVQLVAQQKTLAALRADDRLGPWRELLPTMLGAGQLGSRYCTVESRLPGRDGRAELPDPVSRRRLVSHAVATIGELHRRTARVRPVDRDAIARWVEAPSARLRRCLCPSDRTVLDHLDRALVGALAGQRVAVGWLHGDYYPDNVLVHDGRITGVVDWCGADPEGLVVLDVVAFLLHTEREATGAELGRVVQSWLARPDHPAYAIVADAQRARDADVLSPRALVLISWLHHVANNLTQSRRYAANPLWLHHNVRAVLRTLPRHPGDGVR